MPRISFYSEPDRYAQPSPADNLCIAPTKNGCRCKNTITDDEMNLSLSFEEQAQLCTDEKRSDLLGRALLLRACSNSHRDKLKCLGKCLEELVRRQKIKYSRSSEHRFHWIEDRHGEVPAPRKDSMTMCSSNQPRSCDPTDPDLEVAPKVVGIQEPTVFTSFLPGPKDDLNVLLVQPVVSNQTTSGYVYALCWPSEPEFVKIGYAKLSPAKRLKIWNKCHQEAEILYSAPFMFPERMERIIHLQLIKKRYSIMACMACGRSHIEWFKMSHDEAIQTIRDWEKLSEESVLYTPDRALSIYWRQMIEGATSAVTARSLLAVLEAETLGNEDQMECSALASQMGIMALENST
jgi:hypothetical protein